MHFFPIVADGHSLKQEAASCDSSTCTVGWQAQSSGHLRGCGPSIVLVEQGAQTLSVCKGLSLLGPSVHPCRLAHRQGFSPLAVPENKSVSS